MAPFGSSKSMFKNCNLNYSYSYEILPPCQKLLKALIQFAQRVTLFNIQAACNINNDGGLYPRPHRYSLEGGGVDHRVEDVGHLVVLVGKVLHTAVPACNTQDIYFK